MLEIQMYRFGPLFKPRRQWVIRTDDKELVKTIQEQLWAIGFDYAECPEYYEESTC